MEEYFELDRCSDVVVMTPVEDHIYIMKHISHLHWERGAQCMCTIPGTDPQTLETGQWRFPLDAVMSGAVFRRYKSELHSICIAVI